MTTKSITTSNSNDDGHKVSKYDSGDHNSITHGDGNTHINCGIIAPYYITCYCVSMCRTYNLII